MLFSLVLLYLFICLPVYSCPDGSLEWQKKCYIFNSTETGFAKAETLCVKNGGHLVSIHDAFVNDILGQYASDYFHNSTEFWIGANSLEVQNVWEWTDGSAFDLKDWKKGEPRNGTDLRCVAAIMKDGYWKAESCFKLKPFICETSSDATITSTIKQSTTTTTTTKKPVPTTTSSTSNYSIIVNCSTGWTYFEQTKSLYCVFDAPIDWQNGEDYCKNCGGHLASVHSDEENELLKTAACFYNNLLWIGLYTADNGTTYQWIDKSKTDYFAWAANYPNTLGGDCVAEGSYCSSNDNGIFLNNPCSSNNYSVCKKNIVKVFSDKKK